MRMEQAIQCMATLLYQESQMPNGMGMVTAAIKSRPELLSTPTGNAEDR